MADQKRFNVRPDGGNGYLPSHRGALGAHINKDRLTTGGGARGGAGRRWTSVWLVPLPCARRRAQLVLPIPPGLAQTLRAHLARPRTLLVVCFVGALVLVNVVVITRRIADQRNKGHHWSDVVPATLAKADTCVFSLDEIRKIYTWEVESGNYPSRRRIPAHVGVPHDLLNPSVPPWLGATFGSETDNATQGISASRTYIAPEAKPPHIAYPPRPVPGSIADLDIIMKYCDYDTDQYVRDCLEVLRTGAGLDNGNRMRRGSIDPWKYIYTETGTPVSASKTSPYWSEDPSPPSHPLRKTGIETLPGVENLPRMRAAAGPCDPERPRIFHMYWAGPFTDKPYFTLLSYLFTQPLRLNETAPLPADACAPPQFWIWINPGVHASVPNPTARDDMIATLGKNPWSAPFLHDRFHDVIKFRLWNTTERLDQLDELAGWRESPQLGKLHVDAAAVALLQQATETDSAGAPVTRVAANAAEEDALGQLKAADGAQVIMSDVARFLVTHAFGGAYVDVDNVLLRDWEELWGWRGAWATRWSYHPWYNTAILRMHKGSPLGSFLLKTIMRVTADDQPWHPVAITHYLEDARLDPLLVRIPDAVFDPTFLTFEGLQRARPPFPAWSWNSPFEEFFQAPSRTGADAAAAGFDAFFRGAYSYHWHNSWQLPVDVGRNFPDLGPTFAAFEKLARARHVASLIAKRPAPTPTASVVAQDRDGAPGAAARGAAATPAPPPIPTDERAPEWADGPLNDERDLAWSAVLKRTFEAYLRGERPNMYGEWFVWE